MNKWKSCNKCPPPQYVRVEIKTTNGDCVCGYRYKNDFYETFGNYIIANPYKWRWIPDNSQLFLEISEKIKKNITSAEVMEDEG